MREDALDLAAEIGVAGRVDDVDARALPDDRGALGEDGDAALTLQVVRIHGALGDLLVLAEGAALLQQAVHQRGLAVVDVGDDRDVADVHKSLSEGVCKARLYARSVTAARRVEAASCRCHSPSMRKRSVTIDGHRTSVSLEDAFWAELSAIAEQRGLSLNALVAEIDHGRSPGNLSSALRLFVLDELRKRTISRV